jgi:hypothetical protein
MNVKYYSTHTFLTESFEDLPQDYLTYLTSKKHPIRKLQDQFCYIHAKIDNHKIFNPIQHKRLEAVIRNNLKLFFLEYVSPLPDSDIEKRMIQEAILQKTMLKRMSFNHVFFNRVSQINFFLNYSYSRSWDYFLTNERYSPEYTKHILGFSPE